MAHYRAHLILAACAALAACSGGSETGEDAFEDDTFTGEGMLLAGTDDPTSTGSLFRYDGEQEVSQVSYNAATDTFTVNNLPFDGNGTYDRDDVVASLNGFNVYENNNPAPIREYKALHGISSSGNTRVSIVKTGSYQDFGFGGFVYSRSGSVNLPSSGQATYDGTYAGMIVFEDAVGLNYVSGDAYLEVDFDDLDSSNAVEGLIYNRQVFDQNGNLLGSSLPVVLATGGITQAGEIVGETAVDGEFNGMYYAVIAGSDASEIAGVIVVTDNTAGTEETGGFFAYK